MTAASCKGLAFSLGLALAAVLGACRERTPQTRTIDWHSEPPEKAALLLVDPQGTATLMCLPGQRVLRPLFSGVSLRRILDAVWKDGPTVAGLTDEIDPAARQLVLLSAMAEPRRLGPEAQSARFSPDGSALAYQLQRVDSPSARPQSYVLDLATGQVTDLVGLFDPRWEPDSRHIRATMLRKEADGQLRWIRARWDRQSASTAPLGPGSGQIPAPLGAAVAWSPDQQVTEPRRSCVVRLGPPGKFQLPHNVQGGFCTGASDDRAMRWSSDGQWLAFPHPGPVPGGQDPEKSFLDVVAIAGGRSQALLNLHSLVGPVASEIAVAPDLVWIDWSPSQRFLAIADGAGELRIYDFEAQAIAAIGKAAKPQWSPGGGYLLIEGGAEAAHHALVLPGATSSARIDLGAAREARWLPAQACAI